MEPTEADDHASADSAQSGFMVQPDGAQTESLQQDTTLLSDEAAGPSNSDKTLINDQKAQHNKDNANYDNITQIRTDMDTRVDEKIITEKCEDAPLVSEKDIKKGLEDVSKSEKSNHQDSMDNPLEKPLPMQNDDKQEMDKSNMKSEDCKPDESEQKKSQTPVFRRKNKDLLQSGKGPVNEKLAHLHKLERKHSSGDLHSRLKTRKLLGVGETDDGDVHRSKLSQILGHSEQLYVKLPKGLRIWQLVTGLMFAFVALWALIFPCSLFDLSLESATTGITLPIRLYGATLLSLSVIFWSTLHSNDKDVIRWSLLASAIYFTVQTLVSIWGLLVVGSNGYTSWKWLFLRLIFASISFTYYFMLGDNLHRHIHKVNMTSPSINQDTSHTNEEKTTPEKKVQ